MTSPVWSQEKPLHERFVEIEEVARVAPQRALKELDKLRVEAGQGTLTEQAEFLVASSDTQHGLGKHAEAVALCDQAIAIGRRTGNNDVVARTMISKAYALFSLDQTARGSVALANLS